MEGGNGRDGFKHTKHGKIVFVDLAGSTYKGVEPPLPLLTGGFCGGQL